MSFFRSPYLRRTIASMAILCLVGMTVAPSFAHRASYTSYGEWLRSQVKGGVDANFDRALSLASANRAPTLERFLHVFVESYGEHGDPAELAAVFGVDDLEGSLLVSYLQSRFSGLTPDALPVRTVLTVPAASSTSGSDRNTTTLASKAASADIGPGGVFERPAVGMESASTRDLLISMPRLGP
jgi:hypothetical protein